jgi:serine protease DegQ
MRRTPLYSRSNPARPAPSSPAPANPAPDPLAGMPASALPADVRKVTPEAAAGASDDAPAATGPSRRGRWARRASQPAVLWAAILLLASAWLHTLWQHNTSGLRPLTQQDIDSAVLHTLQTQPLPSATARAAEIIAPSVVRVVGLMTEGDDYKPEREGSKDNGASPGAAAPGTPPAAPGNPPADPPAPPARPLMGPLPETPARGQGTGVVIVDNGTILTNLHVVSGARRLKVEFHNGLVADADLIGMHPEHDLAVLKAQRIPDDLPAATMRSTGGLKPGDNVAAVGFPFGIGPSVSSGVISGLRREFRSASGERLLTNLIQFDAAANPGNSGGPLITMEGEVVGIVTAILNPSEQRTFIGIGFAVPIENAAAMVGMPPF